MSTASKRKARRVRNQRRAKRARVLRRQREARILTALKEGLKGLTMRDNKSEILAIMNSSNPFLGDGFDFNEYQTKTVLLKTAGKMLWRLQRA